MSSHTTSSRITASYCSSPEELLSAEDNEVPSPRSRLRIGGDIVCTTASSTIAHRAASVAVLLALGFLLLVPLGCASHPQADAARGAGKGRGSGAAPVTVAMAEQRDVPVDIQTIGNVEAYSTISVTAQVTGVLTKAYFKDGDYVKKGAPLLSIDPRPYQAALQQAMANRARDEAAFRKAQDALASDQSKLRYQQAAASRNQTLVGQNVISKDQFDQIAAGADAAFQTVKADQAAVNAAAAQRDLSNAAVDQARVQLGYTTIHAPVEGRTGSLNVDEGNVVTANGSPLLTINQISPIYVTFSVAESYLEEIRQRMAERNLQVIARTQGGMDSPGVLTFVDNTVDTTTGTIKLKATFPNANQALWPGQFVSVRLRLVMLRNAVVAPSQAVQTGQNGSFVYVVQPGNRVDVRPIQTGLRAGQDIVVEHGLAPGEVLVTEGQLRLAPGSPVVVRNGDSVPGQANRRGGL